jgi:uncharacterized surface protein with fasciclin (FAS1) repeats
VNRTRIALLTLVVAAVASVGSVGSTASAAPTAEADIVVTATSAGQFKTLTMLLKRAGLVGALKGTGPYTVFAPTDAAFKRVPKSTLNALLKNKAKLKAVLLYHVVSGEVTASEVVQLSQAKTLNGKSVRIRTSGQNVFVNSSKVTTPDVMATNGVIHVVNRVLIPPAR